jgi:hypothetical protein
MNPCLSANFLELASRALWKGVLEPSETDTYVRTLYLKFPLDRVLPLLVHAYLPTSDSH